MWLLRSSKDETYYLLPEKQHVVSRKDGDLILADDQSISRKHAVISVDHPNKNWEDPDKPPVVKVTETGSKYGTVINPGSGASKMPKGSTQRLHDGDQIQFGLQWNIWRLVYEPLIVVMSTVAGRQKKEVKDIVGKLGGHIVSNWQPNCTHLTMCNFTMTIKAISALAYGKAIVIPEFWKSYMTAIETKTELPKYEDFLPPLAETIINKNEVSFLIKSERRTLFEGKQFLFFSPQQYKEHACLVTAAGGTANILDEETMSEEELIQPHVIIIKHIHHSSSEVSETPHTYIGVMRYLQSNGKRVIPVSEIGLAILHCSIEKYCNPDFNFASTMLSSSKNSAPNLASQLILASETQETETQSQKKKLRDGQEKVIIPESGTESKQPAGEAKAEESQPTLFLETPCMAEIKESRQQFLSGATRSKISKEQSIILRTVLPESLKRPRSTESEDTSCPAKRSSWVEPKIDNEDEGLFDFACDEKKATHRGAEEDMFAFKETQPMEKRETLKEDEEGMFAFKESQPMVKQEALLSLSSNHTQTASNLKRKYSEEESFISDRLSKKLALNDISANSRIDDSPASDDELQQDFLSTTKIKKEGSEVSSNDITTNRSIVIVKALVIMQPPRSKQILETNVPQNTKNFKKFKKVQAHVSILPRIIGGRDLVPYTKDVPAIGNILSDDELDEEKNDQDDWAFLTVSQTKKKGQSQRL